MSKVNGNLKFSGWKYEAGKMMPLNCHDNGDAAPFRLSAHHPVSMNEWIDESVRCPPDLHHPKSYMNAIMVLALVAGNVLLPYAFF